MCRARGSHHGGRLRLIPRASPLVSNQHEPFSGDPHSTLSRSLRSQDPSRPPVCAWDASCFNTGALIRSPLAALLAPRRWPRPGTQDPSRPLKPSTHPPLVVGTLAVLTLVPWPRVVCCSVTPTRSRREVFRPRPALESYNPRQSRHEVTRHSPSILFCLFFLDMAYVSVIIGRVRHTDVLDHSQSPHFGIDIP